MTKRDMIRMIKFGMTPDQYELWKKQQEAISALFWIPPILMCPTPKTEDYDVQSGYTPMHATSMLEPLFPELERMSQECDLRTTIKETWRW